MPVRLTWEARFALVVLGWLLAFLADPLVHELVGATVWAGKAAGLVL